MKYECSFCGLWTEGPDDPGSVDGIFCPRCLGTPTMVEHPTSKVIWDFLDQTGYSEADVYAHLRVFIATEFGRDPSILDRLQAYLREAKQAKEDIEKDGNA